MANYYVSSVKWAAFATWASSTAYTVGQIVKRPGTTSVRVYRCEVAGTSGGSQPTWSTTPNSTTSDNGITWRCITCVPSYGWDSVAPTFAQVSTIATSGPGDVIFADSSHDEVDTGTSIGTGGAIVFSVNAAGSVPPVKADYQRGAKSRITATGTMNITSGQFHGVDFVADTGSSSGSINTCNGNNGTYFSDCLFHLKNTNTGSQVQASATLGGLTEWANNTKVRFGGGAGQCIVPTNVSVYWHDSDSGAVASDGSLPTALFAPTSFQGTAITVRGVDLSGFTGTRLVTADTTRNILFEDCLLADSVAYLNGSTASQAPDGGNLRFINCSRVTNPTKQSMFVYEIIFQKEMVSQCVLSDTPDFGPGKQAERHRLSSTNAQNAASKGLILKKWNKTVSALTATVRAIYFGPSLPNQGNFFLSLSYPKDANNSLTESAFDTSQRLNVTAAVSDSSDWTAGAPARANSTSYTYGDFIKVASNPGKTFVKENSGTGTSNGSEPSGFATATPGSTVSDGAVTWRCGIPFKMETAFTPARAGFVKGQVKLYPDSNGPYFCVLNTKLEIA